MYLSTKNTILKKYDAEVHAQAAVEGMLELLGEAGVPAAEIARIRVDIFDVAHLIIGGGAAGLAAADAAAIHFHHRQHQRPVDVAHVGFGNGDGVLHVRGRGRHAVQHHRIGGGADADVLLVGQKLREFCLQQSGVEAGAETTGAATAGAAEGAGRTGGAITTAGAGRTGAGPGTTGRTEGGETGAGARTAGGANGTGRLTGTGGGGSGALGAAAAFLGGMAARTPPGEGDEVGTDAPLVPPAAKLPACEPMIAPLARSTPVPSGLPALFAAFSATCMPVPPNAACAFAISSSCEPS